jgi:hypothetical protein
VQRSLPQWRQAPMSWGISRFSWFTPALVHPLLGRLSPMLASQWCVSTHDLLTTVSQVAEINVVCILPKRWFPLPGENKFCKWEKSLFVNVPLLILG